MCVHTGKQEKNKRAKALLRYHVPSRGKVGTNNYNFFQQFGKVHLNFVIFVVVIISFILNTARSRSFSLSLSLSLSPFQASHFFFFFF